MERDQLNKRFIAVYKQLEEEGIIKNNSRKNSGSFSKKEIAMKMWGKPYVTILCDYLSEKRIIKYDEAAIFAKMFNINKAYLIDGIGQPFGSDYSAPASSQSDTVALPQTRNQILYAPVEAFASSANDAQFQGESEFFQIPGLQGDFIAFAVRGNSMQPTVNQGDIVICRTLYSNEQLKDNEIYAVSINNAVMVKRVQCIWDKNHRKVIKIKLISDNYLEHDPIIEDVSPQHKYWKVEKKVTAII
jgi:phage repressor protein C with HTH and peptisase S24 domain